MNETTQKQGDSKTPVIVHLDTVKNVEFAEVQYKNGQKLLRTNTVGQDDYHLDSRSNYGPLVRNLLDPVERRARISTQEPTEDQPVRRTFKGATSALMLGVLAAGAMAPTPPQSKRGGRK